MSEEKLIIEQDDNGSWIVTDNASVVYGDGDTIQGAIDDYFIAIGEYAALRTGNDRTALQTIAMACMATWRVKR